MTRDIAAIAAPAKSSYKLMKITNQMDDDVQFVESSEFFDPTGAADEIHSNDIHSNEDLQTVAPSVVNNKDSFKKQYQSVQRSKFTNTGRDQNITNIPYQMNH